MPRPIRARELAVGAALALALGACAKKGPPSGGPPDLIAPRLTEVWPDSGASGVPRDARLTLTFSEGMEPRSTGDAVSLAPPVEIRQRRWSARTLTLVLAESLAADRAYTLSVGNGARDRHGNAMVSGRAVVFTTGPEFPPGAIEGKVEAVGFAVPGTALWCYPEGDAPDSTARDFLALGLADVQGEFRIGGLAAPGRYRLWAFVDLNRNRSFEPATDLLAPADTTIEITASAPVAAGVTLRVVNPRAPGQVRGMVIDSLGDERGALRLIVISQADSTRRLLYEVPDRGAFDFRFDPGAYRVRAFRDVDRDRIWKRDEEPASEETRVTVTPAGVVEGLAFTLRRPGGGE